MINELRVQAVAVPIANQKIVKRTSLSAARPDQVVDYLFLNLGCPTPPLTNSEPDSPTSAPTPCSSPAESVSPVFPAYLKKPPLAFLTHAERGIEPPECNSRSTLSGASRFQRPVLSPSAQHARLLLAVSEHDWSIVKDVVRELVRSVQQDPAIRASWLAVHSKLTSEEASTARWVDQLIDVDPLRPPLFECTMNLANFEVKTAALLSVLSKLASADLPSV